MLSSFVAEMPFRIGQDCHAIALVHRIAVGPLIDDDPTQIQVQVVVQVTPIPPCSCTQSWISSGQRSLT